MRFCFVPSIALALLLIVPPARSEDDYADPAMREDGLAEAFAALESGRFEDAVQPVLQLVAAENRHGLFLHALMQLTGAGVPLDHVAGMDTMRAAADAGNATAAQELLFGNPTGTPRVYAWRGSALRTDRRTPNLPPNLAYESDDRLHLRFRPAAEWNQRRAAEGDPVALHNLARFAELAPNLVGTTRDKATQLWANAIELGSLPALHRNQRRFDAHELKRDKENEPLIAALVLHTQLAADAGDPQSQYILGRNSISPDANSFEYQEALDRLVAATNQGHNEAAELLHTALLREPNEPSSPPNEDEHPATTETNGYPLTRAQRLVLTIRAADELPVEALHELEQLARDDEAAMITYVDLVLATPGYEDFDGQFWFERLQAAQAGGNDSAANRVANFMIRGIGGVETDPAAARAILEPLARGGDMSSQLDLYFSTIGEDPAQAGRYREELEAAYPAFGIVLKALQQRERNRSNPPPSTSKLEELQANTESRSIEAQQRSIAEQLASMDNLLDQPLAQSAKQENFVTPTTVTQSPTRFLAPESERTPIPSDLELRQRRAALNPRGNNAEPVAVFQCAPIFPEVMRRADIQGRAIIGFVVDREGVPRDVRIVEATAPIFGDEAKATVARWRFAPGIKDGRAVNTRMQVPIVFNILEE